MKDLAIIFLNGALLALRTSALTLRNDNATLDLPQVHESSASSQSNWIATHEEAFSSWSEHIFSQVNIHLPHHMTLLNHRRVGMGGAGVALIGLTLIILAVCAVGFCLLARNDWSMKGATEEGKGYVHSMAAGVESRTRPDPTYQRMPSDPYGTQYPQGHHSWAPHWPGHAQNSAPSIPPPQAENYPSRRKAGCC
mmetsp:Transcript_59439/g.141625  ORF Transcript_59439/g.141625 Transcript_59439/m.141625 type:complete len:195 (+) Transcript_59439:80-664(+)